MSAEQFVEILQGDAHLEGMPDRIFNWPGPVSQDRKLIFQQAFLLKYSDWDRGIHNCTYRIGWRKFTDLSFLEGTLLSEQPTGIKSADMPMERFFCSPIRVFRHLIIRTGAGMEWSIPQFILMSTG